MTNEIFLQIVRDKNPSFGGVMAKEMFEAEVRHMGWTYFKLEEEDALIAYKKALRSALHDLICKRIDVASVDLFWWLRKKTQHEMLDMKMAQLKERSAKN